MLARTPSSFPPPPRSPSSSSQIPRLFKKTAVVTFFLLASLSLGQIIIRFMSLSTLAWSNDIQSVLSAWSLQPSTSRTIWYPTSFTRDILPKPIHSHNDYWRLVPLYSAISVGAISVEADVWEFGSELFVGHDTSSLTRNRTFRNLYVDPIAKILAKQNPRGEFVDPSDEHLRGVFDVDPGQTLHLFVDFKTPGLSTFPAVLDHLEPLRTPINYLTRYNGTHLIPGLVTVHLTGDAPFSEIAANKTRDVFYDAPIADLGSGKYTKENTLIASAPFGKTVGRVMWGREISEDQKKIVRAHVAEAHERGIMVRYWDTPGWPISVRNRVWGMLVGEGVDLLNADDLKAAAFRDW